MKKLQFPLVLDGATGTELAKHGYTGSVCAEQWVLDHPDAIRQIQSAYIEAGSDAVYASTFSANRYKLEENGLMGCVEDYNRRLASLSLETAGERALVGGDIAPSGHFLAPMGDTGFEELVEVYREQAAALAAAGVDLFAVETMMTVADARAAVLAVRSVSDKPIFVTFTCDANGRTLYGTDVAAAMAIFEGMGCTAFGMNCSVGPDDMLTQIERLSSLCDLPLIAKPNAGMPHVKDGKTVYDAVPEDFRAYIPKFLRAGVLAIGGCCGTDPAFIRVISEEVRAFRAEGSERTPWQQLPLATGKELFLIPRGASCGPVIDCSEDLEDDLEDDLDCEAPLTALRFTDTNQLEDFAEMQYAVKKPLCILCEDPALLEQVLRLYQGRALYRGSIAPELLAPLTDRYGLIIE